LKQLCLSYRHFWLATVVWQVWSAIAPLHAAPEPRRVLLLFPYNITFPADFVVGESLRSHLEERSPQSIVFYADFLDLGRFPDQDHELRTARYLALKYAKSVPDVIVALGPQALRFVLKHRSEIGANVPVVFASISAQTLATINLPQNVTGVTSEFDLVKALKLAKQLQPAARDLVVISGASPFDRRWARTAQRQLKSYEQRLSTRYLVGLTQSQLFAELRGLRRDTIVLFTVMFMDATGKSYIPWKFVSDVAKVSNAPVYAPFEIYLGRGIVGGFLESLEDIGDAAAEVVEKVLAGANLADMPPRPTNRGRYKVDGRQMTRWGLSDSHLPPGSVVRFREPTIWERFFWEIIVVLFVILFQSTLIAGLLYQRRQLRQIERDVRHRASELAYVNRKIVAGQLSASIAHEINQPLAAIVSSGSAGLRWLAAKTPDLEEVAAALKRIVSDGHRAGRIVENVRAMFKRGVQQRVPADINLIIAEVVDLMGSELKRHRVAVKTVYTQNLPKPVVDRVQLQQVIVNLIRNASDSMQSTTNRERILRIRTEMNESYEVLVSIEDTGVGIDPNDVDRLFDPFFTTKPDGMGMGLSICRSILEAHGGRLSAAPRRPHGAIFEIALPTKSSGSAGV
jgi:signal transduction histidine kinase